MAGSRGGRRRCASSPGLHPGLRGAALGRALRSSGYRDVSALPVVGATPRKDPFDDDYAFIHIEFEDHAPVTDS